MNSTYPFESFKKFLIVNYSWCLFHCVNEFVNKPKDNTV